MNKRLITAIIAFFIPVVAGAAAYQTLSFATQDINIGARAVGMGGAFTAMVDDSSAVYYNTAGLAKIKNIEFYGAFDKWLMDANFTQGYVVMPVGFGAIGGAFTFTDFGKFQQRDDSGALTGAPDISPNNIAASLSYGFPVNDMLSAGLGVKYSNLTIDDYSESAVMFDLGLQAQLAGIVMLGAALQNLDTSFTNGYNVRLGVGTQLFEIQGNNMRIEADAKYSGVFGMSYAVGLETNLFKVLAIRAGYDIKNSNNALSGLTGLTLGLGITIDKLSMDYAFSSNGDLGMSHLVGLKLLYEGSEEKEKKNYKKMTDFLAYQSYKDGEDAFNEGNYKRAQSYWEEVKGMAPDYEGIDIALDKVKKLIASGGSLKKVEELFSEGMSAYEEFDFDKAVKKWLELKKMYPSYKDLDVWLNDAKELKASKGMSKQSEKSFREGLKYYNSCDYAKALAEWQKGLEKDPKNLKISQYIERTKEKQKEIKEGIRIAKADVANDSTVIDGVKRLRNISNVCPAYQDAADILSTLKELISLKTKDYYYKGIDQYTNGNLDAAIVYWNNIEALDPKSDYLVKVRRYISDARNKQKALMGINKLKKK